MPVTTRRCAPAVVGTCHNVLLLHVIRFQRLCRKHGAVMWYINMGKCKSSCRKVSVAGVKYGKS